MTIYDSIEEVDNLSVEELNLASACILHKSHGKDRSLADSYRTISSCPFLSKALDTYIAQWVPMQDLTRSISEYFFLDYWSRHLLHTPGQ